MASEKEKETKQKIYLLSFKILLNFSHTFKNIILFKFVLDKQVVFCEKNKNTDS